jgi:hypothetical protein
MTAMELTLEQIAKNRELAYLLGVRPPAWVDGLTPGARAAVVAIEREAEERRRAAMSPFRRAEYDALMARVMLTAERDQAQADYLWGRIEAARRYYAEHPEAKRRRRSTRQTTTRAVKSADAVRESHNASQRKLEATPEYRQKHAAYMRERRAAKKAEKAAMHV